MKLKKILALLFIDLNFGNPSGDGAYPPLLIFKAMCTAGLRFFFIAKYAPP